MFYINYVFQTWVYSSTGINWSHTEVNLQQLHKAYLGGIITCWSPGLPLSLINSALQAGDNVSELVNDASYITLADIPTFVASDYDLEDFTNAGVDPYAHLSDLSTGITNLDYIPSPTQGIVTSDTGSDATIPLADGTNAGLLSSAEKTVIANTSGTNTGDQDISSKEDKVNKQNSLAVDGTNTKYPTVTAVMLDWL